MNKRGEMDVVRHRHEAHQITSPVFLRKFLANGYTKDGSEPRSRKCAVRTEKRGSTDMVR